ncbi:MAG: twin-arginine translocase subunit TatC [Thermoprotei archaeon]|nr:MAG: twin-arginine translocase subunit TatC [Thermoprotei archaeon]
MSNEELEEGKRFQEHLEELLIRARRALIAIVIGMAIASIIPARINPSYETLVSYLIQKIEVDLLPEGVVLMASSWTGVIMTYFYLSFLIGFLMASPVVSYEIYKYVAPALYPHEKRHLTWFTASFTGLFVLGVLFAYFLLLPWTYKFLIRFAYMVGASPFFSVDDFLSFTVIVMLAVGLTFTFPVITTLLVKVGVITPEALTSHWRETVLAIFIISALITPDVSGFTMIMLAAPIIALYCLAVAVAKIIYKGEAKTAEKQPSQA